MHTPILCPACSTAFDPDVITRVKRGKAAGLKSIVADLDSATLTDDDKFLAVDDDDALDDVKIDGEEDEFEDSTLLEDDEDDASLEGLEVLPEKKNDEH